MSKKINVKNVEEFNISADAYGKSFVFASGEVIGFEGEKAAGYGKFLAEDPRNSLEETDEKATRTFRDPDSDDIEEIKSPEGFAEPASEPEPTPAVEPEVIPAVEPEPVPAVEPEGEPAEEAPNSENADEPAELSEEEKPKAKGKK